MLPELGSFALILSLCFALLQGSAPLWRARSLSVIAAYGQFIFLSFALLCLIASLLKHDITVLYVREHSHTLLPLIYRIGAAWGGHEGSLLLWCLILSAWTCAFIGWADPAFSQKFHANMRMILGWISSGFIAFLFFTSNPFQRAFPTSLVDSNDLMPILQDPGLIFHPPMLYLGYVGFALGFAFSISALFTGKLENNWAKACKPWIILPWSFLSAGIVLGSWWAYRELGWGGWWFWDPVENASLLPWLAATALIHSLIVNEKRGTFQGWTLLLAIITFTLSLLGTFLVRSGVLVSVHAFASDPTRGIFLLGYLALLIGGALFLYAVRIKHFYRAPNFGLFSRETGMLINSVVLLTAVFTIVIGTLYPIVLDALGYGKISVGEPYFNLVFTPIILPLLLLMGLVPHLQWGQANWYLSLKKIRFPLLVSLFIGGLLPTLLGYPFHVLTAVGISLSNWIILATLQYIYVHKKFRLAQCGMVIAHLGIAVLALGITLNKSYSAERQLKILPGETILFAGYHFTLQNVQTAAGPNYRSIEANFKVMGTSAKIATLSAQQRIYVSHQETLSKPGILVNPWRDLYLALGNSFPDGGWAIRIYYKPFVRWIWAGGFLLLLGGLLSLLNTLLNRYRHARR